MRYAIIWIGIGIILAMGVEPSLAQKLPPDPTKLSRCSADEIRPGEKIDIDEKMIEIQWLNNVESDRAKLGGLVGSFVDFWRSGIIEEIKKNNPHQNPVNVESMYAESLSLKKWPIVRPRPLGSGLQNGAHVHYIDPFFCPIYFFRSKIGDGNADEAVLFMENVGINSTYVLFGRVHDKYFIVRPYKSIIDIDKIKQNITTIVEAYHD